jgi:hypothetical protein
MRRSTKKKSAKMNPSGTKLVVALATVALALGAGSWWYRYQSAHRATQFWGPASAELIVEPGQVEALTLQPATEGEPRQAGLPPQLGGEYAVAALLDLTNARGTVHLRHALTSDGNYVWNQPAAAPAKWRLALRFHDADQELLVLFTADLATLGKSTSASPAIEAISCQPMAATLRQYFTALGLVDKPASTE